MIDQKYVEQIAAAIGAVHLDDVDKAERKLDDTFPDYDGLCFLAAAVDNDEIWAALLLMRRRVEARRG